MAISRLLVEGLKIFGLVLAVALVLWTMPEQAGALVDLPKP